MLQRHLAGARRIIRHDAEQAFGLGASVYVPTPRAGLAIAQYIVYSGYVDSIAAIAALAALAQPTRLDTFRLLVGREPEGVPAGELGRLIAIPQNTMSAHLAVLSRAGLIIGERHSRLIIYRANLDCFRQVALFLLKDCCGGRADLCAPLIADLTPCCAPAESAHG